MINTALAQSNMVKQQLRTGNVLKNNILNLYQTLPREYFVPREYKQFAYSDLQIPLGHEQKMLTPLEEASILQALKLEGTESVLEVGTGSGYFTALLAQCVNHVLSIDINKTFIEQASKHLSQFNIDNVTLSVGDAHRGWMDKAPYDVIVITGAIDELSDIFRPQLMKGGKLFAIIGKGNAMKGTLFQLNHDDTWSETVLFETHVSPLTTAHGKESFFF
jgi:protein-L-isoaspartate(D-aspartate) O-methyltransferase